MRGQVCFAATLFTLPAMGRWDLCCTFAIRSAPHLQPAARRLQQIAGRTLVASRHRWSLSCSSCHEGGVHRSCVAESHCPVAAQQQLSGTQNISALIAIPRCCAMHMPVTQAASRVVGWRWLPAPAAGTLISSSNPPGAAAAAESCLRPAGRRARSAAAVAVRACAPGGAGPRAPES